MFTVPKTPVVLKPKCHLDASFIHHITARLDQDGPPNRLARLFPKNPAVKQPVHAVYTPADKFGPDTAAKLGGVARKLIAQHAASWVVLPRIIQEPGWECLPILSAQIEVLAATPDQGAVNKRLALLKTAHGRTGKRLEIDPVEYLVACFEDGLRPCSNKEEDEFAVAVGMAMAAGMAAGTLPWSTGLRVKSFQKDTIHRSMRTLDLVLTTLTEETKERLGRPELPANFAVTLPKVSDIQEVRLFVETLEHLETEIGLPAGSIKIELMIETPQSVVGEDGRCPKSAFAEATRGRLRGTHLGPHDLLRSMGIAGTRLSMDHPYLALPRKQMLTAFAETGIWISDGATTRIPAGNNTALVHEAWQTHYDDVIDQLAMGFFQGWDLCGGHLVMRHLANIVFFLEGFDQACDLLSEFMDKAAAATRSGNVFNDMATAQVWLNYVRRAINCGAVTYEQVLAKSGLSPEEVQCTSFAQIIERRQQSIPPSGQ